MDRTVFEEHMLADERFQKEVRDWQQTVATKEDIAKIIKDTIEEYFKSKGKFTFSFIVGLGLFVGALVTLFGGIKTVLAWIGFSYLNK